MAWRTGFCAIARRTASCSGATSGCCRAAVRAAAGGVEAPAVPGWDELLLGRGAGCVGGGGGCNVGAILGLAGALEAAVGTCRDAVGVLGPSGLLDSTPRARCVPMDAAAGCRGARLGLAAGFCCEGKEGPRCFCCCGGWGSPVRSMVCPANRSALAAFAEAAAGLAVSSSWNSK